MFLLINCFAGKFRRAAAGTGVGAKAILVGVLHFGHH
jgi:hypothetical protein